MKRSACAMLALPVLAVLASAVLAAQNPETTVKGHIRAVNPSTHRLEVATDEGKDVTLHIGEAARLERNGKAAPLDAFKKGMRVKVTFAPRDGENRVVAMTAEPVTADEVRNDIRDTLKAAKTYTFEHKDVYRKRLEHVMHEADDRIEQLQDQAAQAGAAAHKEYDKQIRELRRLRERAQTQIERVQAATPQTWQDLKSGVGSVLEDLGRAFEQAGKQIR